MTDTRASVVVPKEMELGDFIGYAGTTPVYLIGGAGKNDDDSDDDDNASDDDDEDGDDEETVTISKSELDELKRRKSAANKEAMNRRKWLEAHGIDPHTGKKADADDDDEEEDDDEKSKSKKTGPTPKELKATIRKEVDRAVTRTEMKYKAPLAKAAATAALTNAGYAGKNPDRVMRLVDLDEIDVDDEGNVTGIEEQIADIKDDFPEWFRKARRSRDDDDDDSSSSTREVDGGNKSTKSSKGKGDSARERMRKQILGR